MSCDYAVWNTSGRLDAEQAGKLHQRLCEGDTSGVVAHAGVGRFYAALIARYPELDDASEGAEAGEACPWSAAIDRSEGHVIVSCVWPRADEIGEFVRGLAAEHGLAFYDPQSELVLYPGEAPRRAPWWKFW
jgi:hypothetical protein